MLSLRILRGVVAVRIDLTPFLRAGGSATEAQVRLEVPVGPVEGLGRQAALARPATIAVDLRGNAARVAAHVVGRVALRCPCDRCLDAVSVVLGVDYREDWLLRPGRAGGAPDAGMAPAGDAGDEDDAWRVLGEPWIDVADGFWQNVALSLPSKVLCRADCRGLCPRCGADLNRASCRCPTADLDPRLAALAAWRPAPRAGEATEHRQGPRA